MILDLVLLVIGFAVLVWSADRFVFGAAAIANNFGIAPMIIGLTVVAMGSSAPEIMVAFSASMAGQVDTAVGNALGSNITNIALVLGVTAILKPMLVSSSTLYREMPVLLVVTGLAGWILHDLQLAAWEGWLLLFIFVLSILYMVITAVRQSRNNKQVDAMVEEASSEVPRDVSNKRALLWLVVGIILLPLSADILVDSATNIAKFFGISDLVIGLTIIAIGTSLPELAACIAGVLKKEDDLVLGNIIGSNLFNILTVLAIPAIFAPGMIDENAYQRDYWVMLGLTVALFAMAMSFLGKQRQISRWEGVLLLASFIGYQILLFTW